MIYGISDKFLVGGVLCEVRYINCNKAWVCPVEDVQSDNGGVTHYSFVAFDVLNEKGVDRQGRKALHVVNVPSGAV